MRVFGYVRVSTDDQADRGTSLDGQRDRIRAYCDGARLPAPDLRTEVESAGEEKIERRVELARLVADAQAGDVILVAMLDRWSRDIVYGVSSIRALTRRGVRWVAIHEQIDASTPHGDEQLGLRMWLAESERRRIRERTHGRRAALSAQGWWVAGNVPWGYRRGSRAERRQGLLEADPAAAPIVAEAFARAARGESTRALAAWLRAYPGAPHDQSGVRLMLRSRTYLGEMPGGAAGRHPALVDRVTWDRAQAALDARRLTGPAPRSQGEGLLLAGALRCALCGRRCGVTAVGELRYYVCAGRRRGRACPGPYVRVELAEAAAVPAILGRLSELRGALASALPVAPAPEDLRPARAKVEAALQRAARLAVDGLLSAEDLARERRRLLAERDAIDRREAEQARAAAAADPSARATLAGALAELDRAWAGMGLREQREALGLLAERVELGGDRGLVWTWRAVAELV